MARITIEDCIDKFESRFELVLVASNRARKLHSGESPTVEKDNDKPTVIALREIADESVPIDSLKDKLIEEYQTVSPLDEEELSLDFADSEIETSVDITETSGDITETSGEITENQTMLNEKNIKENISNEDISNEDILKEGADDSTLTTKNDEYSENSDENNSEN